MIPINNSNHPLSFLPVVHYIWKLRIWAENVSIVASNVDLDFISMYLANNKHEVPQSRKSEGGYMTDA